MIDGKMLNLILSPRVNQEMLLAHSEKYFIAVV